MLVLALKCASLDLIFDLYPAWTILMAISKMTTYDVLKHYFDGLTINLRLNVTRKVLYIGLLSLLEQFTIYAFYELFSLLCWNFAIIFSTKLNNVLTMSKKIL